MENRIKIGDVWYVKEDSINQETSTKKELTFDDITTSKTWIYENSDYCWEACLIAKNETEYYNDVAIEFTNKLTTEEEYWDNPIWFTSILEGEYRAIEEALTSMNEEGLEDFKLFLEYLKQNDILK